MNFIIDGNKYVIQGVGNFDPDKMYPIQIEQAESGNVALTVADIENFDETIDVYLYDSLSNTYTLINNDFGYQANLPIGSYVNRFYITFKEDNTLNIIDNQLQDIIVNYLQSPREIYIKAPQSVEIKQIYLINTIGQTVRSWNSTNTTLNNEMRIPVSHVSEGNYIIQVQTGTGNINTKAVIKY